MRSYYRLKNYIDKKVDQYIEKDPKSHDPIEKFNRRAARDLDKAENKREERRDYHTERLNGKMKLIDAVTNDELGAHEGNIQKEAEKINKNTLGHNPTNNDIQNLKTKTKDVLGDEYDIIINKSNKVKLTRNGVVLRNKY